MVGDLKPLGGSMGEFDAELLSETLADGTTRTAWPQSALNNLKQLDDDLSGVSDGLALAARQIKEMGGDWDYVKSQEGVNTDAVMGTLIMLGRPIQAGAHVVGGLLSATALVAKDLLDAALWGLVSGLRAMDEASRPPA